MGKLFQLELSMNAQPGTYALILEASNAGDLAVGRLGILRVQPGWYVYLGSAFGPGGVKARCRHHLQVTSRPHWHIDYLRPITLLHEIWFSYDPLQREHLWADVMGCARGAVTPFSGFGATDCGCRSHLLFQVERPSSVNFRRRLLRCQPQHGRLEKWYSQKNSHRW